MRSFVPDYDMVLPADLPSALSYMSQGYQPFSGGTDIMVLFNAGKVTPLRLVNIRRLAELTAISVTPEAVEIGAAVTYTTIREHATVCEEFPLLSQSASWTGSIANQNRGTLGGNVANASPAADSSPVLLVYEAELKLVSSGSERWLPYSSFHLGYKSLALRPGELIAAFRLPRNKKWPSQYGRKIGARRAQAISKISFAAAAETGARVFRIAAGSVAPVPLRCTHTEEFLSAERLSQAVIEQAKRVIREEISPITDIRSTREYRLAVTENLLGEFLETLL